MTEGINPNFYLLIMIPGVGYEIIYFIYLIVKLIKEGITLLKLHLKLRSLLNVTEG